MTNTEEKRLIRKLKELQLETANIIAELLKTARIDQQRETNNRNNTNNTREPRREERMLRGSIHVGDRVTIRNPK